MTLVEILIVVAIMVILLAITSAAVQKTVEGQRNRTSREQCYKLQQSLDIEYERVVKQCDSDRLNKKIPPEIVQYCGDDMNRAVAVWTAIKLRQQFPENFAEATSYVYIDSGVLATGAPSGTASWSLKPLATFTEVAGLSSAGLPQPARDESAALLYIIMTKKSVGGAEAMAAAGDDLGQQVTLTFNAGGSTRDLKAFKDGWNKPVGFRRWYGSIAGEDEVQAAEYAGSGSPTTTPKSYDPLDTRSLLLGWTDAAKQAQVSQSPWYFNGRNRLATVYSLGKIDTDASDDLMGFRLRRYGNSGGVQQP
jgi:type II secretory pathway pseudopilin PulG